MSTEGTRSDRSPDGPDHQCAHELSPEAARPLGVNVFASVHTANRTRRSRFWTRRKRTLVAVIAVLGSLPCAWFGFQYCKKTQQVREHYQFDVSSTGWDTEIVLNGQPVAGGGCYWDFLTPYVIDGKNTVRIIARPVGDMADRGSCSVKFYKVQWDRTPGETVLHESSSDDAPGKPLQADFEFTASVPVRWLWQDADDLAELTDEDRSQIFGIYEQVKEAFRRKDWRGLRQLCSPASRGLFATELRVGKDGAAVWDMLEKLGTEVSGYDDYSVSALLPEDIGVEHGSKIVRIHPKHPEQETLISAVGRGDESCARTGFYELRFIKVGGRWHWIHL